MEVSWIGESADFGITSRLYSTCRLRMNPMSSNKASEAHDELKGKVEHTRCEYPYIYNIYTRM